VFILVGYFMLMFGIGAFFYRYMRAMKDYFAGGNTIPWWLSGVSFYMTSFSAFLFVAYSEVAYRHGLVAVTMGYMAMPAVLVGALFLAGRWRRARIDSPVEYLEARYGLALRQVCGWANVPIRVIDNGLRLYATGLFVGGVVGIPVTDSILYCGVITLLYTFAGGLWAVTVTDFVQFVVMMVGALILVPLSLARVGGVSGFFTGAPPDFFHLTEPSTFGPSYVVGWFILVLFNYNVSVGLVQRYYCVRNESEAKKVGYLVGFLVLVGTPIFFIPAMAARQYLPDADPKNIYAILCTTLLPAGALGLIIAAMFSATMSSLSGDYNAVASILTNDVYKRLIRPQASERRLVVVGRVMTIVIGMLPLAIALYVAGTIGTDVLFRKMVTVFSVATPPLAIPMLAGLVWRRVSNMGAILGFISGVTAGLVLYVLISQQILKLSSDRGAEVVLTLSTTFTTLVVMIVFSLLCPAKGEEAKRSAEFARRLETPVPPVEAEVGGVPAPFRIVGVCMMAVAALMMAIAPFMGWNAGTKTNLVVAVLLLVPGAYWAVWAGKQRVSNRR
jgi:SSS family transporter